jgi:hypothetical protein
LVFGVSLGPLSKSGSSLELTRRRTTLAGHIFAGKSFCHFPPAGCIPASIIRNAAGGADGGWLGKTSSRRDSWQKDLPAENEPAAEADGRSGTSRFSQNFPT